MAVSKHEWPDKCFAAASGQLLLRDSLWGLYLVMYSSSSSGLFFEFGSRAVDFFHVLRRLAKLGRRSISGWRMPYCSFLVAGSSILRPLVLKVRPSQPLRHQHAVLPPPHCLRHGAPVPRSSRHTAPWTQARCSFCFKGMGGRSYD